jgi:hypothetical protein
VADRPLGKQERPQRPLEAQVDQDRDQREEGAEEHDLARRHAVRDQLDRDQHAGEDQRRDELERDSKERVHRGDISGPVATGLLVRGAEAVEGRRGRTAQALHP